MKNLKHFIGKATGVNILLFSSIVLLSLSIVLLFSISYKGEVTFSPIDINSVIGSFIAICTTFVVGFQIWNYIYSSKKIEELDSAKETLVKEMDKLKEANLESRYYNAYTIGRMRYQIARGEVRCEDDEKYYWNALRALANALRYAAQGGHDFDDTYTSLAGNIYRAINKIVDTEGHLFFNRKFQDIYGLANEIDEYLYEIYIFIKTDVQRQAKYYELRIYAEKWHDFLEKIEPGSILSRL